MIQLTEERQRHEAAIAEYKLVGHMYIHGHGYCVYICCQVFQQMDEGNQKQKEELNQELLEVKVGFNLLLLW